MKKNKPLVIIAILLGTFLSINAQDALSPYSRYGYGTLRDNATSAQRSLGGIGYAMQNGRQINVMNPASYAAMDSLTFLFDMGIDMNFYRSTDGANRFNDYGGGLDYITMQFPIFKNIIGASVGLLPFSSTGYGFGDEIEHGTTTYQGDGGINMLYGGVGISPFIPGLSVGANIAYMFGTTRNDNFVSTSSGSTALFERVMEVHDYYITLGAQYRLNVARNKWFVLGVTYSPSKKVHGSTYGIKYDSKDAQQPDTTQVINMKHGYELPSSFGIGLSYNMDTRLLVEVDYTYQPWKKAKYATLEGFEETRFDDRWKISGGVQYTPNVRGNWIQRVSYRVGAFYDRDYIMIGKNHITRKGLTCGFGLPVPKFKTTINLGFEYNQRKASPMSLVKENNFMITLGVNFNELWFWQTRLH